jgi:hypothetical protein
MAFWRHNVQRKYQSRNYWEDGSFQFSELPPDEYHKYLEQSEHESAQRREFGSKSESSIYRIVLSHEIAEDDYKNQRIYTIPISQYLFHNQFAKI